MNKPSLFFSTNPQKILTFFLERPDSEFYDAKVSEMTGISRAGTNLALRMLHNYGYLVCEKRGRMRFYKLAKEHYLIRQYKVLYTLERLHGLLDRLKPLSQKVVLFGSQANGTDNEESDIDMLIITRDKEDVNKIITGSEFAEKIRAIIKSPAEMIVLGKNNTELVRTIDEGIILWEENMV